MHVAGGLRWNSRPLRIQQRVAGRVQRGRPKPAAHSGQVQLRAAQISIGGTKGRSGDVADEAPFSWRTRRPRSRRNRPRPQVDAFGGLCVLRVAAHFVEFDTQYVTDHANRLAENSGAVRGHGLVVALKAADAMRSTLRSCRVAEDRASSVAAKAGCRCKSGARRRPGDLPRRPSTTIAEPSLVRGWRANSPAEAQ
jgi:hypothetical protein